MKKLTRAVACVGALLVGALGVQPAEASPGNAVLFGDSLVANPTFEDFQGARNDWANYNRTSKVPGCGSDNQFPQLIGAHTGRHVDNYSCAGASFSTDGQKFPHLIQTAINNGDLDRGTSTVYIMGGINDTYWNWRTFMPVAEMRAKVERGLTDAINQIRAAAPQAHIKVVGYPHIANGNGNVCLVNLIPNAPTVTPIIQSGEIEWMLEDAQRAVAQRTNTQFVSLKPVSNGHEMCSPDRYIVGLIDTTAPDHYNLVLHLTNTGVRETARAMAL